jgi:hypothetical protein
MSLCFVRDRFKDFTSRTYNVIDSQLKIRQANVQ